MSQTQSPAAYSHRGEQIDYTPVGAVYAGDVVLVGTLVGIASVDIAAGRKGSLNVEGVYDVPKITGAVSAGAPVFWNAAADPVSGTAGTGAAQGSASSGTFMGFAEVDAASGDATVRVQLLTGLSVRRMPRIPTTTVAAAGSVQGDAAALIEGMNQVTASDATKGVLLPPAVAGAQVIVKNSVAAVLKVWPSTGDGINAVAVNSAYSMAASTCSLFVAYDATTWYSLPLVAS